MKSIKKTITIIASAFISLCFCAGCAESVVISNDDFIKDMDVAPTQTAIYEEYTKQAVADYFEVADRHIVDGDVDYENEEVQAAARIAAAKLYAYACYNERGLDRYVYFSAQEGDTDISAGTATAMKQEYFLRINESDATKGYKYHYTIKKVSESTGTISMFKSLFESARTRIVVDTDILYRLEGSNISIGDRNELFGVDMLECDWKTGSDWGITDKTRLVKGEYIEPDKIIDDIVLNAGEEEVTIHANINILADNIVKSAIIIKDENEETGLDGYIVFMSVDTEVANSDEASLKMLRRANDSDDCCWVNEDDETGLAIIFRLWENGLFRTYSVSEKWTGTIKGFSGTADSSTVYYYSYSDRDCDMTKYLEVLNTAIASKGE